MSARHGSGVGRPPRRDMIASVQRGVHALAATAETLETVIPATRIPDVTRTELHTVLVDVQRIVSVLLTATEPNVKVAP